MSIIIGLTGRAGSGKDTAGEYLRDKYGLVPMSFAGPLKKTAAVLFNLSEEHFHDRMLKEMPLEDWDGMSPRRMLQLLGTEAIRNNFGPNFWIKRWLSDYHQLRATANVVVTDVRFHNEAQAIRDLGGIIIHVIRPDHSTLDSTAAKHSSEGGVFLGDRDRILRNEGSIEDLYAEIDELFAFEEDRK